MPIDLVCDPGACRQNNKHDRQSTAERDGSGMRAAFIGFIKDLIFPCEATEIANSIIGDDSEQDEYDDDGHRMILNENSIFRFSIFQIHHFH